MADKREQILSRLLAVAQGIPGIAGAFRNKDEISDETADDADPVNRPTRAPRRIAMTPEIYLLLGAKPENVGTEINALRATFIKSVLTDAGLLLIVGTNGDIRYEGCATSLARGRNMEGEMGISFSFAYTLRPEDL